MEQGQSWIEMLLLQKTKSVLGPANKFLPTDS